MSHVHWVCPACGLGLSWDPAFERQVRTLRRTHLETHLPSDFPVPACATCNNPLAFPTTPDETFKACPLCERVYCDHTLAQREDGVCQDHPA